ncbi:small ribosomal subunit protein S13, mitochondrial-like [Punica granatum]|uniref:Uncharacterized protein n=2 Tax=Punica granatum TaxID=22663 RepID=A0A218XZF8_PUNGR|nr:small ribosomal subunit protein S13, mitochondrial-like [Punica granatum]OWM90188.1 hypothetical protein CDL15_Pgr006509 [Punica granatum]PKI57339.1 hypothetical protein CRG98_022284 [Punica granatum]
MFFASRPSVRNLADVGRQLLQNSPLQWQAIRGIRVGNTEIPNDKGLLYALQHIKGIGRATARQILAELRIGNKPAKELSGLQIESLRNEVSTYTVGHNLDKETASSIKRLMTIQCYRGIRHIDGYPCRGQRTRSNARTRKAKAARAAAKQSF